MKLNKIFNKSVLGILVFWALGASAQTDQDPVHWHFSSKKIDNKTFEIHATASIDYPWHIYSGATSGVVALPTTFKFNKNPFVGLVGSPKEIGEVLNEKEGSGEVKIYEKRVDFVQTAKLKRFGKTNVSGTVNYMACTQGRCLTPESKSFSVALK